MYTPVYLYCSFYCLGQKKNKSAIRRLVYVFWCKEIYTYYNYVNSWDVGGTTVPILKIITSVNRRLKPCEIIPTMPCAQPRAKTALYALLLSSSF